MKRFFFIALGFSVFTIIPSVVVRADESIKEGKWQVTTSIKMKAEIGNTSYKADTNSRVVRTKCVTNANPVPDINKFAQTFSGCVAPQIQKKGSTVDYSIACNDQTGQITLNGHVVFTGDTMQGEASMNAVIKGKESSIQTHLTGKYIGPC